MPQIITDGKGNYLTLDASGQNWVPTQAPTKGQGELGYPPAPPEDGTPAQQSTDAGPGPTIWGHYASPDGTAAAPPKPPDAPGPDIWGHYGSPDSPPPPSPRERIVDTLSPAPDTTYGNLPLSWVARDDKTGQLRFAMPSSIREPLLDIARGTVGAETTANPQTGQIQYGMTPGANALLGAVTGPGDLRFGPPSFVPPGTFDRSAPLSPQFQANPLSPQGRAAATAPPAGPVTDTGIPKVSLPPEPPTPAPAAPPPTPTPALTAASADPPIMSQADIQARGRGYFDAADQAASKGAVLPDANAAAVRKLFTDFVPSDPEAARISAGDPAMQAAKNVDASGPMSYDTAMRIDRDLTSRMRGASGTDAHELSQLQQGLRDQMDQVPDLDSLRPGRQAWMQSIKQGQMEDINAGAALKNDPAQEAAYIRQRAAALLKNPNAMRYWTPEEQASLTQVAQSGDIGMLGRLTTAMIKPITRVALGTAGHFIAGPLGAIVGGEVGGDIGATAAANVRSRLSPTDLTPVMQQITRGVPPPPTNQLMRQPQP